MNLSQRASGASMIEFALVLPLLLLVFFGGIETSVALYDKAMLTNAAREGARAAIVRREVPLTSTGINSLVENVVKTYCGNNLISLGPDAPSNNLRVQAAPMTIGPGDNGLRVVASYDYHGIILGRLLAGIAGPVTLTAEVVMRYE